MVPEFFLFIHFKFKLLFLMEIIFTGCPTVVAKTPFSYSRLQGLVFKIMSNFCSIFDTLRSGFPISLKLSRLQRWEQLLVSSEVNLVRG